MDSVNFKETGHKNLQNSTINFSRMIRHFYTTFNC